MQWVKKKTSVYVEMTDLILENSDRHLQSLGWI